MPRKIAARLQPCKSWKQGLPIPEIVFYTEPNFGGENYRTNCDVNFIGDYIPSIVETEDGGSFEVKPIKLNGSIKSVVVVSGEWQLYKDAGFKVIIGDPLTPGYYPNIDIENVGISSAECFRC